MDLEKNAFEFSQVFFSCLKISAFSHLTDGLYGQYES